MECQFAAEQTSCVFQIKLYFYPEYFRLRSLSKGADALSNEVVRNEIEHSLCVSNPIINYHRGRDKRLSRDYRVVKSSIFEVEILIFLTTLIFQLAVC